MPPRVGSLLRPFLTHRFIVSRPLLPFIRSTNINTSGRLFTTHHPRSNDDRQSSSSRQEAGAEAGQTLSARLKSLIKSYGWYALGVYLFFSAVDFSVAFAAINVLGAEQVGRMEAVVKDSVTSILHGGRPEEPGAEDRKVDAPRDGRHGLYAMLILAYTVHKTVFLPFRIGLTAAFTPQLVGWLRSRGWTGSDGARRAASEMRERMQERRNR